MFEFNEFGREIEITIILRLDIVAEVVVVSYHIKVASYLLLELE